MPSGSGRKKKAGGGTAKPRPSASIGSAAKRRHEAAKAGKPVDQPRGPIGKARPGADVYMTRDAARRLRLAKAAAVEVLASGGNQADAARAAQAYGSAPCGSSSDDDTGGGGGGGGGALAAAMDELLDEGLLAQLSLASADSDPAPDLPAAATAGADQRQQVLPDSAS